MEFVSSFSRLLLEFSSVLTAPSFANLVVVPTGWTFARRRTVTAALVAAGVAGMRHHSAFHRLFSSAVWNLDDMSMQLFERQILPSLPGTVELVLDDTLMRKRGKKMYGTGMHHDPLCSTRRTAIVNWGLSWTVVAVPVVFPFHPTRVFAIPIMFRLYLNKKASAKAKRKHRTRAELGLEMVERICAAHPDRRFHLTADAAYSGMEMIKKLPPNCDLTGKLKAGVVFHRDPPQRRVGKRGRPAKLGRRLPEIKTILKTRRAERVTQNAYGRKATVRAVTVDGRLRGAPDRPIRVVAVEPITGKQRKGAFFTTCRECTAGEVLERYARRWSIEQMFRDVKTEMGAGQPQGWSKRAVLRTGPTVMLQYALTVLWFARSGHVSFAAPRRPWHKNKTGPSFADMLATLRLCSMRETFSAVDDDPSQARKIIATLVHAYAQVA